MQSEMQSGNKRAPLWAGPPVQRSLQCLAQTWASLSPVWVCLPGRKASRPQGLRALTFSPDHQCLPVSSPESPIIKPPASHTEHQGDRRAGTGRLAPHTARLPPASYLPAFIHALPGPGGLLADNRLSKLLLPCAFFLGLNPQHMEVPRPGV